MLQKPLESRDCYERTHEVQFCGATNFLIGLGVRFPVLLVGQLELFWAQVAPAGLYTTSDQRPMVALLAFPTQVATKAIDIQNVVPSTCYHWVLFWLFQRP